MLVLAGSMAMSPALNVGCVSNFGIQVAPPSVLFQTPPSAPHRYMVFAFFGSSAMQVTRPILVPPTASEGPSGFQNLTDSSFSIGLAFGGGFGPPSGAFGLGGFGGASLARSAPSISLTWLRKVSISARSSRPLG